MVSHDGGKTHTSVFKSYNYTARSIDCSGPKGTYRFGRIIEFIAPFEKPSLLSQTVALSETTCMNLALVRILFAQ